MKKARIFKARRVHGTFDKTSNVTGNKQVRERHESSHGRQGAFTQKYCSQTADSVTSANHIKTRTLAKCHISVSVSENSNGPSSATSGLFQWLSPRPGVAEHRSTQRHLYCVRNGASAEQPPAIQGLRSCRRARSVRGRKRLTVEKWRRHSRCPRGLNPRRRRSG
ncbi:hypothetical protein P4O66_001569 [Electrophorus voltai]|uniref:Uncharacterized protein n=1 Tax=Electrophorus voltai TaxID=2609070 RepID=A0AAD9DW80_9TELE|nr:hypothetical protein P4O66_001569 [Electrophorus voltai]